MHRDSISISTIPHIQRGEEYEPSGGCGMPVFHLPRIPSRGDVLPDFGSSAVRPLARVLRAMQARSPFCSIFLLVVETRRGLTNDMRRSEHLQQYLYLPLVGVVDCATNTSADSSYPKSCPAQFRDRL